MEKQTKKIEEDKNIKEENLNNSNKDEKKSILKKIIIILVLLLFLVICGKTVYTKLNKDNGIAGVKKILSAKYSNIECINYSCDGFVVIDGDKLSKYKVFLYNKDGKKVANYKVNYDSKKSTTDVPVEIGDDLYISTSMNVKDLKVNEYSINNKKGKVIFTTKNELSILNDEFILMKNKESKGDKYSILNKKGKEIYKNISDIDTYLNGKYIVIKSNDSYSVLNMKGEKILDNYKINKIITNEENKELYAIVENMIDKVYNYYNLKKEEIVGDSFNSYKISEEKYEFIITKKENEKNVKYILSKDGKQTKIIEEESDYEEIKEKIDDKKYNLYNESLYSSKQENVLVDSKEDKSIGILNIKENKYNAIYNYKQDRSYFYSTVSQIDSKTGDKILKISCSNYVCDNKKTSIYNMNENKELYKSDDISISDYMEYSSGSKVIEFSNQNENKYSKKTVIFDKNNEELEILDDSAVIIDDKLVIGKEGNYSLYLYSIKNKKVLNEEKVSKEGISDKVVYKYKDKNDNTIILNSDGKEVIKVSRDDYIKLSDGNYIYIKDEVLYIYSIKKDKVYKYKLKENEKLNDASGDIINPYRKSIFINNSNDKYVKILNFKGNQIDKIKNVEISSVKFNGDNNKVFIIVKKTIKEGSFYGLYVAE